MKNSLLIFAILTFIIINLGIAQEPNKKKIVHTEFKVSGVCDMCKKRIEYAALNTKGVISAEWDKKSQILHIVFNTRKTSEKAIQKNIAKAGHDTEKIKTINEIYLKLPRCCAYRDNISVH